MSEKYKIVWILFVLLALVGFGGYCVIHFVETLKGMNATDFEKALIFILFCWLIFKK